MREIYSKIGVKKLRFYFKFITRNKKLEKTVRLHCYLFTKLANGIR